MNQIEEISELFDWNNSEEDQAAGIAFDHAYTVVMYVAAGVLAVGALITGILLRRYGPGSQSSAYPTQH